jgi:hypothetical protein
MIFGTVIPVAAIAVAAVLVITHHPARSTPTTGRSIQAFNACLKAKVDAAPGQAPDPTALQQDAGGCATHLPAGMRVPDFSRSQGPPASERQAYDQCLQAALANQRGPGRAGFDRQAFENASVMCRAVIVGSGPSTPTTPAGTASGSPTA